MSKTSAEDVLSEEELDNLLSQISTRTPTGKRNLALLRLMADTGLRVSEAVAVETRDIIEQAGQLTGVRIRNGKGGKKGRTALTPTAAVALARWLAERKSLGLSNGAVFCTISKGRAAGYYAKDGQGLQPGRAISPRYVQQVVKRMAERAGIERSISPHTLRHTFATRLLRSCGNLEVVRKACRHSDIRTTAAIYSHLVQEDVDAAILELG